MKALLPLMLAAALTLPTKPPKQTDLLRVLLASPRFTPAGKDLAPPPPLPTDGAFP